MNARVFSSRLAGATVLCALVVCGCQNSNGLINLGGPSGTPPEDEEGFTVLLRTFSGEKHVQTAKYFKEQTEKDAAWRRLFVVHKADHSELFWGTYRSIDDAQDNLKKAKAYRTGKGIQPYAQAIVVPLPGKDVGRPEWSLKTAKGFYTVLVAVFYDVPEADYVGRKRFAADYCEELRRGGEEAYYLHDPGQSIVTVGTFAENAVEYVGAEPNRKAVIRDEGVQAVRKRHPRVAVNGREEIVRGVNPQTGKVESRPRESYVMKIPHEEGGGDANPFNRPGQREPRKAP